ncbi:WxcM-like, C-terminal [Apibacter mensalis]|uniref:WxcM-like, C-terminal n=1 Tax=Apibacter mensalis TaxID=1586267 RepID=A0A0X3AQ80_9FLAO|nr:FdtA/QdtA family cupin domain-containing protein [Apibacter mensalis]CVK16287.1 WxcM-like, C-terminal [Apibacter mensalis]
MNKPHIIELSKIGSSVLGYITVAEENLNIPFNIKRVYWTYFTPQDVQRGGHAHKGLEQLIFAVSGNIEFTTEDIYGNTETFILDSPEKGLYIPSKIWRDIKFSHNAVLLCLASDFYKEQDYIRNYDEFKKLMK